MLKPGNVIGTLTIDSVVGEGSKGRTYIARDTHLGLVALKVPLSPYDFSEYRHEQAILTQVDSPYVMKFHRKIKTVGFVLEYVGVSVEDHFSRDRTLQTRMEYFRDICYGLDALHQKHITHGDMKWSNTRGHFIDDVLQWKLIDLSLAQKESWWSRFKNAITLSNNRLLHPFVDISLLGRLVAELVLYPDYSKQELKRMYTPDVLTACKKKAPAELMNLIETCTYADPDNCPQAHAIAEKINKII